MSGPRLSPGTVDHPWVEGEPHECDGSAWDRLPPLVRAEAQDRDFQERRAYAAGQALNVDERARWRLP